MYYIIFSELNFVHLVGCFNELIDINETVILCGLVVFAVKQMRNLLFDSTFGKLKHTKFHLHKHRQKRDGMKTYIGSQIFCYEIRAIRRADTTSVSQNNIALC